MLITIYNVPLFQQMSTDIFNYFSLFVALFYVSWSGIAFCPNLRGWQSKTCKLSRKSGQFTRFAGLEMHFAPICEAGRAKLANCLAEVGNLPDLLVWKCILLRFARLAEQNSQIVSQKWRRRLFIIKNLLRNVFLGRFYK